MVLGLEPSTINLWATFFAGIHDESLLQRYRSLLTAVELERCQRFHFELDRKRYLVTRAMLRTVLSRYAPIAPQDWSFTENDYGRPAISNAEAARIEFNISHTSHLILIGITASRKIGVDVEDFRSRTADIDLAERFFTEAEAADVRTRPAGDQNERFFEYWTLKESYIKARGRGLSIPLNGFSFKFTNDQSIRLAIDVRLKDHPARWHFWQFSLTDGHIMAVCAQRLSQRMPTVILNTTVPLTDEVSMEKPILKRKSY